MFASNRAFTRIGSAYEKLGDLTQAIENYNKSLTEHRTPEALAKLRAAEKAKITAEKDAYVSPELAEKARELGQQKFQEADWPGAVDAFTEMTKRAPKDPRGFSNRAAALIKLMAFPQAVQDCDEAIARDSKFIRAYMRKGQALVAMKEYNRAIDTFTEAAEHDDGTHAREIEQQQQKCLEAQFSARAGETEQQTMERIQNDPEVRDYLARVICCGGTTTRYANANSTSHLDHGYPWRPRHAEHSEPSQERPRCSSGAYEERLGAHEDSEADGCRCHSHGPVSADALAT